MFWAIWKAAKRAFSVPVEENSSDTSDPNGSIEECCEPVTPMVRKTGFVAKKLRNHITVNVDDELVHFSLENLDVVAKFTPELYDRVTIICEMANESKEISNVRGIEFPIMRRIAGNITYMEPGIQGIIDTKYVFYWSALSESITELNRNDRVTADCVECEIADGNEFQWRCVLVTIQNQPIDDNLCENIETMNLNGIEMTENIEFEFNDINETKELTVSVKNTSDEKIQVLENFFISNKSQSQLSLLSPLRKDVFFINPGMLKEYRFQAKSKFFGDSCEHFAITFSGATQRFRIHRPIRISVRDAELKHKTIGTGPNVYCNYNYTKSVSMKDRSNVISGPPAFSTRNFVARKLEKWPVPTRLKNIVFDYTASRSLTLDRLLAAYPHLNNPVTMDTYRETFHDVLYLEECEMEHCIRKFDVTTHFTRENEFLVLAVENVIECRPSILVGDHIFVSDPRTESTSGVEQRIRRGWIYEVRQNEILVKFDENFHKNYRNEKYQITFHFSRQTFRKQHHAIELASKRLPMVLFPDEVNPMFAQLDVTLNLSNGQLQYNDSVLPWFNESLNIVQKQTVVHILQGVGRPLPFVIFGPPGTGKSMTIVEAILQIVKNVPFSRVLVAAPSNSAANLLTERIIKSGVLEDRQFLRLVSYNRVVRDSIPTEIIGHCGTIEIARDGTIKDSYEMKESGLQIHCNASRLKKYRLLIGTCITIGTLMQCDFPEDYFSHVIIDECGQCTETEVIIPMTFVDKNIGQIVLVGDPKQLGPIVLSNSLNSMHLCQSFLVRLLDRAPYKAEMEKFNRRFDHRLVTQLIFSYRSVPSITEIYNHLFYDNDLEPMLSGKDSAEVKLLKKLSPILPNHGKRDVTTGIIFIEVKGKNEKCADSPSWFNSMEASAITGYVKKLMAMGQTADDIGIITPYIQQVRVIRAKLKTQGLIEPKVGTVEEFQGQERNIILLSTVRTMRHNDFSQRLGFIGQPNRMNVAISRARALLIVFGCRELLSFDENWKWLIEHCEAKKSYLSAQEERNPFLPKSKLKSNMN